MPIKRTNNLCEGLLCASSLHQCTFASQSLGWFLGPKPAEFWAVSRQAALLVTIGNPALVGEGTVWSLPQNLSSCPELSRLKFRE